MSPQKSKRRLSGASCVVNLLEEVDIDRPVALLLHRVLGAAHAEIEGFVGADVDERRGKLLRDLREPILDERQRAGLARAPARDRAEFPPRSWYSSHLST